MKLFICVFLLPLFFFSCNDDDNNEANPADQLPPATQTGENTFGCLIDSRPFTPQGGGLGGPSRGASYQFIYNDGDSYYNFQVNGVHLSDPFESIYMNVQFQNFDGLQKGRTYTLGKIGIDNGGGGYFTGDQETYETDSARQGTLTITHYDYDNRILSGTFEFEVEVNGEIVKITDGRFDMDFTI